MLTLLALLALLQLLYIYMYKIRVSFFKKINEINICVRLLREKEGMYVCMYVYMYAHIVSKFKGAVFLIKEHCSLKLPTNKGIAPIVIPLMYIFVQKIENYKILRITKKIGRASVGKECW